MTLKSDEKISTEYSAESKSLVVKFNGGDKWIPSWDFSQTIKSELIGSINNNDVKTVVVDLEHLTNISSEGLWLLLWPKKYLEEKWVQDPKVIIANPNPSVLKVIKIVQLDNILDIQHGRAQDILAALQSEAK